MRTQWNGREIAYEIFGSGPAVVFCHGTPWSSELWRPFAEALAGEFTVYLWDMPGYGESSKSPAHPVDLGVQGEALTYLLEFWGLGSPHIVAHDYGGAVALRAHLLHGYSYASLCLVDVVALRPWGSEFFTLVRENADVFSRLPPAVHGGMLRAYIAGASHKGLSDTEMDMLVRPWMSEEGRSGFYRQIAEADESFTAEFESRLGDISIPVRIVWGTEDTWIPVDRSERLASAIPGSDVVLVSDAGHLIQLDAPVALATVLHSWLDRNRSCAPNSADSDA